VHEIKPPPLYRMRWVV